MFFNSDLSKRKRWVPLERCIYRRDHIEKETFLRFEKETCLEQNCDIDNAVAIAKPMQTRQRDQVSANGMGAGSAVALSSISAA